MADEMTEEEIGLMVSHLKAMKVKPKLDTLDDFQAWMRAQSESTAETSEDIKDSKVGIKSQTMYSTSSIQHFPKMIHFSGDSKKDASYDVWRSEVACIMKEGHSGQAISQAIRSSLRGEALKIRSRLPHDASISQILAKMDSVYGIVEQSEMLLARFYSAKQGPEEEVSAWSCRVEDLLNKASKDIHMDDMKKDSMLRTIFWSGLQTKRKDITGHLYERISDFDQLRVAIRRVEAPL